MPDTDDAFTNLLKQFREMREEEDNLRAKQINEIVKLLLAADDYELIETIRMFLLVKARVKNMSSNREAI